MAGRLPVTAGAALRTPVALLLLAAAGAAPLLAQGDGRPARVEGTVFDSLAGRPLEGATVTVGERVTATTAADGSFSLEAPAGRTTITFTHPDIPAWARPLAATGLELEPGRTTRIPLSTLSAATVLSTLCEGRGTLVGGRVLDLLTLVPVAGASVDAQVGTDGGGRSTQTAHASGDGSYHLCVGASTALELRARLGSERSRTAKLRAGRGGVSVRDLFIPLSEPAQVLGLVRDASTGRPLADAAVRVVGTRLGTFTREDGRFTFRGVPPGEVGLSVELLGYGRREAVLRAEGGSRVEVELDLFPEAVALDSMVVSVRGGRLERVEPGARFDGLDRAEIDRLLPRSLAFDDLLRNANVPGLRIRDMLLPAPSGIRRPSICIETSRTSSHSQDTCQMVEVYLNDVRVSEAETFLLTLDPASVDRLQLLSRAQAGVQYAGTDRARNGVLLIWTRGR